MFQSLFNHRKTFYVIAASVISLSTISLSSAGAKAPSASQEKIQNPVLNYPKYGEWRVNPNSEVATLIWWNERMAMVPVLSISFYPDKIVLDASTPVWPDTGILFYIKDKTEKLGLNMTLLRRTNENCFYQAVIYTNPEKQEFINDLVSSRKARLITPSSYSQSLSLKHVDQAMHTILANHSELHFSLPSRK